MTASFKTILCLAALSALAFSACSTAKTGADTTAAPVAETEVTPANRDTATLTVNLSGFETQQGAVMAALSDEAHYGGGEPLRGVRQAVESDTLVLTFKNLPVGTYALRLFHDVDGNGELNTNLFGIPTEPYAFSNNATGTMGPAPWEKAKFEVTANGVVQDIRF